MKQERERVGMNLHAVTGTFVILDTDRDRVFSKYYPQGNIPYFSEGLASTGERGTFEKDRRQGTGEPTGVFMAILIHSRLRVGELVFDWILDPLVVSRGSIPRCVGDVILDHCHLAK